MKLSDLFGGVGAESPFDIAVISPATGTNVTITTSPAYFWGFAHGASVITVDTSFIANVRTGSVTGSRIFFIGSGPAISSLVLNGGIYCPNGIYITDVENDQAIANIFYRNA